jgi:c-di-GMP-binding flagellar brake protein YcgR
MSLAEPVDLEGTLLKQPDAILATLLRLLRARPPMRLMPEEAPADLPLRTRLVDVDAEERLLFLERLPPEHARHLPLGAAVPVAAQLGGSQIQFDTLLLGPGLHEDHPVLRARFPEALLILERRASFRLRLPLRLSLPPSTAVKAAQRFSLRLLDLSLGGAAASTSAALEPGDRLRVCLGLTEGPLILAAEVRWVAPKPEGTAFGLQFLDVDQTLSQRLAREIGSLQRGLLRRRAG